jgi:hypothetical protein
MAPSDGPPGKLPALQFYPGDWRKDPGVQALDYHDRGVWFECLCMMHESGQRGRLTLNGHPMPDPAIAQNLGIPEAEWKQTRSKLEAYGIASVDEDGTLYNRRMVRDEATREARRKSGAIGGKVSAARRATSKRQANAQANPRSSVSVSVSPSVTTHSQGREREDEQEEPSAKSPTAGLEDLVAKSIRGCYGGPGREGTDERVWSNVTDPADRERMLATAVIRWQGSGHAEFNGKFFRTILQAVVAEQSPDERASSSPFVGGGFQAYDADFEPGGWYGPPLEDAADA